MNKKAFGDSVVTIFLVLISITAVMTTIAIIIGTATQSANIQESPEYNCIQLSLDPPVKINGACLNGENEIEVKLLRDATSKFEIVDSLIFSFYSNKLESVFQCTDSCENCEILNSGTTKDYFFSQNNPENLGVVKLSIRECEINEKEITVCR